MPRPLHILVILHIFYRDQIPWFLKKLSVIHDCNWDLILTGVALSPEERQSFLDIHPDTRFLQTDNVGYDVWPFIQAIGQVNLDEYDFVVKLHTKAPIEETGQFRFNSHLFRGYQWRDSLVDALLQNKRQWEKVLRAFKEDPDCGMVCQWKTYITSDQWPEDGVLLQKEMERLGIHTKDRRFCAGTIFAIRSRLLHPVLRRNLSAQDFPDRSESHSGGSTAHIYERVFSLLVPSQGYKVRFVNQVPFYYLWRVKNSIQRYFKWVFDINRDTSEQKRKYLRIFGFRIYLES